MELDPKTLAILNINLLDKMQNGSNLVCTIDFGLNWVCTGQYTILRSQKMDYKYLLLIKYF